MADDWAEALAPVEPTVAAMGDYLRGELAAGRGYLPAGPDVLRAFTLPLAGVRVLIVGQDPYPTPGHAVGLSFSVGRDVRPLPRPEAVRARGDHVQDHHVRDPRTAPVTGARTGHAGGPRHQVSGPSCVDRPGRPPGQEPMRSVSSCQVAGSGSSFCSFLRAW